MKSEILMTDDQKVYGRWTRRVTNAFLKHLGSQPVFMDIDVISGVWKSRRASIRNNWEGGSVTKVVHH